MCVAGRSYLYLGVIAKEKYMQEAATEADARAKMLIYLLENKLAAV